MREQPEPRLGEVWVGVQKDHRWVVEVNRVQAQRVGFRVVGGAGGRSRHRLLTLPRAKFLHEFRRKHE